MIKMIEQARRTGDVSVLAASNNPLLQQIAANEKFASLTAKEYLEYLRELGVLLPDQVIRNGDVLTLTSAVHHQRNSPCMVYVLQDENLTPYRVIVMPLNHEYLPRRDVLPFDVYVDLGKKMSIKHTEDRELFPTVSYSYENFLSLFDTWVGQCELGVSAIGEPRRFLPIFFDIDQYEGAKSLWSHGLMDDWATKPYRFLDSIIAYENDRAWMNHTPVLFGKNTRTQWMAKMGFEIDRSDRGPLRVFNAAMAFNKMLTHTFR